MIAQEDPRDRPGVPLQELVLQRFGGEEVHGSAEGNLFPFEFSLLVPFFPCRFAVGVLRANVAHETRVLARQRPPLVGKASLNEVRPRGLLGGPVFSFDLSVGVRSVRGTGRVSPTQYVRSFSDLPGVVGVE